MKINDSKLYGRVIFGYIIVFFIIAQYFGKNLPR